MNKARRFLGLIQPFLDFVNAVGQRIVRQQVKARQQAVEGGNPLFRLLKLHPVLLVVAFMRVERALQLAAAAVELTDLFFRIVFKRDGQMATDKATEGLVLTLRFLHVE